MTVSQRRSPTRLAQGALSLVGAALLIAECGTCHARPAEWLAEWESTLRAGKWDRLRDQMTPAAADELAKSPPHLYAAARAGAIYLPIATRKPEQLWVATWFVDVGATLSVTEVTTAEIARALAAVAGVKCRIGGAVGSGASADDAQAIADRTTEYYSLSTTPDGGVLLAEALGWMRGVLGVDGVERDKVLSTMDALVSRISSKATGPALVQAKAEIDLAHATVTEDAAAAKAAVERCIAALRPLLSPAPAPRWPATVLNEAITMASERRLGVRADYAMEELRSSDGKLRYRIPIGLAWTIHAPGSGQQLDLRRLMRGGANYLYTISVYPYAPEKPYKPPTGAGPTVMGSDIKGLAAQRLEVDAKEFATVSSRTEPKALTFGHGFGQCFYVDLAGTLSSSESPMVRRAWVVKGKLYPTTYNFIVDDRSGSDAVPAELDAVLDSLAEVKGK